MEHPIAPPPPSALPAYIRPHQVQQFFSLSRSTLYRLLGQGAIESKSIRRPGHARGIRLVSTESIRAFIPQGRSYLTLGTDGFGRSDTRAALREFFGVDAASIAQAARHSLQG